MASKILLTGANSPIGAYFSERIAASFPNAQLVCGYGRSAPGSEGKNRRWVKLDFFDPNIEDVAAEIGPVDSVVHLASLTPGNNVSGKASDYYVANVFGVMALLKTLAAKGGLKRVFYFSSSAVYNRAKGSSLNELSEKTCEDHYGLSKLTFERELETLHAHRDVASLGLRVPVLLTKGVKWNFLSKWKTAIASGQRITLANPDAPFNAVCPDYALFEACSAFLTAGEGCVVQNIFSPEATTLRAILDKIECAAWDEVEAKAPAQTIATLHPKLYFPTFSALEVVSGFLA